MKYIYIYLSALLILSSCRQKDKKIVDPAFADSLIQNYSPSQAEKTSESNLLFWQKRFDSIPENFVNGPKYASALLTRFKLYGNIHDLLMADSLMQQSNIANQGKEDELLLTLANFSLMKHQFPEAFQYVEKAKQINPNKYGTLMMEFDAVFEAGQYDRASAILRKLPRDGSFAYNFRRSKYEHYASSLDSAIFYMIKAGEKAGNNRQLKQIAFSNAADLCVHNGNMEKAYRLYKESIETDAADFHSITGLGWIALVHDKNDSLAEKIFSFVHQHTSSPDVLLKMEQVADARGDSISQKKWANEFVEQVTQPYYGNMYNKYLIGLYTGILNEPAKAVSLAEQEIKNRPTPQTYAWLAWTYLMNKDIDKAYSIFKPLVSGKPLEGLELYYMGKLMISMNKGYNAQQYFKAAFKNRYDLSPAQVKDLEKNLE